MKFWSVSVIIAPTAHTSTGPHSVPWPPSTSEVKKNSRQWQVEAVRNQRAGVTAALIGVGEHRSAEDHGERADNQSHQSWLHDQLDPRLARAQRQCFESKHPAHYNACHREVRMIDSQVQPSALAQHSPDLDADMRAARPANRRGLHGIDHVGLPCRDPDGNRLEVVTYERSPLLADARLVGKQFGLPPWSRLVHDWRPRD